MTRSFVQAMGEEMASFSAMAHMAGSLPPNARYVTHRNECYDWGTLGWLLLQKKVRCESWARRKGERENSGRFGPRGPWAAAGGGRMPIQCRRRSCALHPADPSRVRCSVDAAAPGIPSLWNALPRPSRAARHDNLTLRPAGGHGAVQVHPVYQQQRAGAVPAGVLAQIGALDAHIHGPHHRPHQAGRAHHQLRRCE